MKCIQCNHSETKVTESRELYEGEVIRRRRECLNCNLRFTTYERFEQPLLMVIKKDGRRENFSREKVASGIYKACEKRQIPQEKIEQVITKAEKDIRAAGDSEITSKQIGEIILAQLADFDNVSYVRFASVYQSFGDINSFKEILDRMEKREKKNG
jgi:transcriptional repressor NrdR